MMEEAKIAESLRDVLLMLSRHGVPVKVPAVDVIEKFSVRTLEDVSNWALRPDLHEQPMEVRPVARLVK